MATRRTTRTNTRKHFITQLIRPLPLSPTSERIFAVLEEEGWSLDVTPTTHGGVVTFFGTDLECLALRHRYDALQRCVERKCGYTRADDERDEKEEEDDAA